MWPHRKKYELYEQSASLQSALFVVKIHCREGGWVYLVCIHVSGSSSFASSNSLPKGHVSGFWWRREVAGEDLHLLYYYVIYCRVEADENCGVQGVGNLAFSRLGLVPLWDTLLSPFFSTDNAEIFGVKFVWRATVDPLFTLPSRSDLAPHAFL